MDEERARLDVVFVRGAVDGDADLHESPLFDPMSSRRRPPLATSCLIRATCVPNAGYSLTPNVERTSAAVSARWLTNTSWASPATADWRVWASASTTAARCAAVTHGASSRARWARLTDLVDRIEDGLVE